MLSDWTGLHGANSKEQAMSLPVWSYTALRILYDNCEMGGKWSCSCYFVELVISRDEQDMQGIGGFLHASVLADQ